MLEEVFKNYRDIYQNIIDSFYPSLGSTGFQERNLTVNFSKAYEKTFFDDNAFGWFELQFGDKNNNHFDCVIINKDKREIYFIEAKRFDNSALKIPSIINDVERIYGFVRNGLDDRFEVFKDFKIYGAILADVWLESNKKKQICESYKNKTFFNGVSQASNKACEYNVLEFNIRGCKALYSLLSFVWEI